MEVLMLLLGLSLMSIFASGEIVLAGPFFPARISIETIPEGNMSGTWENITQILNPPLNVFGTQDDSRAVHGLSIAGAALPFLVASYDLQLPLHSSIVGYQVVATKRCPETGRCCDSQVFLRHPTQGLSQNRAQECDWKDTYQRSFYGGPLDLWGWSDVSVSSQVEVLFSSWHPTDSRIHHVANLRLFLYFEGTGPTNVPGTGEVEDNGKEAILIPSLFSLIGLISLTFFLFVFAFVKKTCRRSRVTHMPESDPTPPSSHTFSQETSQEYSIEDPDLVLHPSPDSLPTIFPVHVDISDSAPTTFPEDYEEMRLLDPSELLWGEQLGEGAYGVVQKSQATWRGISVAVKLMKSDLLARDAWDNWEREVEILQSVRSHPNVIKMIGVTTPGGVVMEFCAKGSLKEFLWEQERARQPSVLQRIIKGVSLGMAHLHSQGIVHRDLAARNVLLTEALEPKVSDFGLSRFCENDTNTTQSTVGPIKLFVALLTSQWMAPESLRAKTYSFKSDVWSFGVILWEILHGGESPFPQFDAFTAGLKIVGGLRLDLPPPATHPVLYKTMEGCFQENPNARPSFEEISQQLEHLTPQELCRVFF